MTDTSPTFLLAIRCRDCPAAAICAFVGTAASGSAIRAYIVSLCAVYSRRASSASSAAKAEKRVFAWRIYSERTNAGLKPANWG